MATLTKLRISDLVDSPSDHVPEQWRKQFDEYLSTGQGTAEFFEFLDSDPAGQLAVESALTQRATAFDHFTTELKQAFGRPDPVPTTQIVSDLERVAALSRDQRTVIADQIAVAVNSFDATSGRRIREFFSQLGEKFSKM